MSCKLLIFIDLSYTDAVKFFFLIWIMGLRPLFCRLIHPFVDNRKQRAYTEIDRVMQVFNRNLTLATCCCSYLVLLRGVFGL